MAKDGYFTARINKSLMEEVHGIFSELGLSKSEALTLFYTQVKASNGLPFPLRVPNRETRRTFEETDAGQDLHYASDVDDLFRQLEQ